MSFFLFFFFLKKLVGRRTCTYNSHLSEWRIIGEMLWIRLLGVPVSTQLRVVTSISENSSKNGTRENRERTCVHIAYIILLYTFIPICARTWRAAALSIFKRTSARARPSLDFRRSRYYDEKKLRNTRTESHSCNAEGTVAWVSRERFFENAQMYDFEPPLVVVWPAFGTSARTA